MVGYVIGKHSKKNEYDENSLLPVPGGELGLVVVPVACVGV